MSRNWSRHLELQLVDNNDKGISLSGFKVTFKISWQSGANPKVAEIKIYNLSESTSKRITGPEFTRIRIFAGYGRSVYDESEVGTVKPVIVGARSNETNVGLLFGGDIRLTVTGRETSPDNWLVIQAIDGHEVISSAVLSATLAKGYTAEDMYDLIGNALKPYGVVSGNRPIFPITEFPRGYTFHGKVSAYLDRLASLCGAEWQILNDRLDLYTPDQISHEPINISSRSGVIGMPQQISGNEFSLKCLINPDIQVYGLIKLDNKWPYPAVPELGTTAASANAQRASGGIYKVYGIVYKGDSRGTEWYMDIMCRPLNSQHPSDENVNKWSTEKMK
ncbi:MULTISPECIES: hypothetical protein [unclassified Cedecea]|uniref:hypothetical protein n=1 Tax=unclassified Cedecea TaxID=2649846 RepID=UPI00301B2E26